MTRSLENFFLRAKAWQVFLLLVGLYIAGQVEIANSVTEIQGVGNPARIDLQAAIIGAIFLSAVFFWLGCLGVSLNGIVKPDLRANSLPFLLALLFSTAILLLLSIFLNNPTILKLLTYSSFLVVPCMLYSLSYIARGLVAAETNRRPSSSEWAGPFFLLWFFPIGIWFIQPRLNKLVWSKNSSRPQSHVRTSLLVFCPINKWQ